MTTIAQQLLTIRNEVKTYLPRVSSKQFNYILREHTSWPETTESLVSRQIALYMSAMGIRQISTKSVVEKKRKVK
jgi:hypothetical protein